MNEILEGLQIFAKYGKITTAAEYDEFYAAPVDSAVKISEEDKERLKEIGWRAAEFGGWWEIFT